jgi:hypothetical protein
MTELWTRNHWFPTDVPDRLAAFGGTIAAQAADPHTLLGVLAISASGPSFWYTLAYTLVIVGFGVRRIRRRATPYVTAQTLTLMAIQVLPLFLLPEIILPLLGGHGLLPTPLADALFPAVNYGTDASTGARTASSSRGPSTCTTSSRMSRCGRGSRSVSCRRSCSSRSPCGAGARSLLRLDLLVRRARRDARRRSPHADAARPTLESPQPRRSGTARDRVRAARPAHRRLDPAR